MSSPDPEFPSDLDLPPEPYGAYLGLLAVVAAVRGDLDRASENATAARATTRTIEARYYSALAELLVALRSNQDIGQTTRILLESCQEHDYLEPVILAWRACPELLAPLTDHVGAAAVLRRAASRARDRTLMNRAGGHQQEVHPLQDALTNREREVLQLIADGLTNAEIARRLFISPSTAKVHVRHILDKLGAKNRLEAVLVTRDLARD